MRANHVNLCPVLWNCLDVFRLCGCIYERDSAYIFLNPQESHFFWNTAVGAGVFHQCIVSGENYAEAIRLGAWGVGEVQRYLDRRLCLFIEIFNKIHSMTARLAYNSIAMTRLRCE